MNDVLKNDLVNLEEIINHYVSVAKEYLRNVNTRPVSIVPFQLPFLDIPHYGDGAASALSLFAKKYLDGLTASSGPRSFGYVVGGVTPAALVGDWLTSAFDQDNGEGITVQLEVETIRMISQLFDLSSEYFGSFVSGATMANFVGLATAREWAANELGINVSQQGLYDLYKLRVIGGKPHSSIFKALSMLGMGRESFVGIPCVPYNEEIDVVALEKKLVEFQNSACIVVANAGTVNDTSFDNLVEIGKLKRKYKFWLHVDASFGLFAACSPKYSHLVSGIEGADSITVDAHKWLNVPYDSAIQFTRQPELQRRVFQNSNSPYLSEQSALINFMDYTPETSRRLRALTAWFTMVAYGKDGYRDIVESCCDLTQQLAAKINESPYFNILRTPILNVVCFTFSERYTVTTQAVKDFLERLTRDGQVFLTSTVYQGIPAIRAAQCNWRTTEKDIEIAFKAMENVFESWQTELNSPNTGISV